MTVKEFDQENPEASPPAEEQENPEASPPAEEPADKPGEEGEEVPPADVSVLDIEEGESERAVSSFDYIISLMGYAIGVGNLWRFPYLVGRWGGGSFVVAYLVCLVLIASPMYFLELHWGHFSRQNTFGCFRMMHPRWVGVGLASAVMLVFVLAYYNMLLAYSLVYLFNSFKSPLPWTPEAREFTPNNLTASEDFFRNTVLHRFENIYDADNAGYMQWHLVLTLFIVWVMVYFALFKGMKSSAKVSYFTVGLPILLVIVMIVRCAMLEGAKDGVEFYIGKFEIDKFKEVDMWADACTQILFSLSPGMGTAITLSSYTRKKEDIYFVNLLVTACNSCFSLSGGFAVFSIIGFMSHRSCNDGGVCRSVKEIAEAGGPSLAFVTLAEGVSQFGDGSNVFSVMFFIMLLTLGLDSTFAWVETINTYVHDTFDRLGRPLRTEVIAGITATFFFLMGLPFCTRVGFELLDVVDHYVTGTIIIAVCFIETLMFHLHWDWSIVEGDMKAATMGSLKFPEGRHIPRFWKYTLLFSAPVLLFAIFWFRIVEDCIEKYGPRDIGGYPGEFQALGWSCMAFCLAFVPAGFIYNRNEKPDPLPLLPWEEKEQEQEQQVQEEEQQEQEQQVQELSPNEPIA